MAGYERRRNADTLPMYEFTSGLASFGSIPGPQNALLAALEKKTDGASWVLGALTGSISIKELFSPASLLRMIGLQGFLKVLFPHPGQPG
jgi:hypothetical protein